MSLYLTKGPLRRIGRALVFSAVWATVGGALVATWLVISDDADRLSGGTTELPSVTISPVAEARSEGVAARLLLEADAIEIKVPVGGTISRVFDLPDVITGGTDLVWTELDGNPLVLAVYPTSRSFYRGLQRGDSGGDVELLQEFLASRGFYAGDVDGRFGFGVQTALVDWRESVGAGDSKTLEFGDLILLDSGGRLTIARAVKPGEVFAPGDVGAMVDQEQLTFRIRMPFTDALAVEPKFDVVGDDFVGTVTEVESEPVLVNEEQFLDLTVEGELLVDRRAGESLAVKVSAPAETQIWIPASAVAYDDAGSPFVRTPNGDNLDVVVSDSADGAVAVVGVDESDSVVVPNPALVSGTGS